MAKYTAKENNTCVWEGVESVDENGEKVQNSVKHTWTAGTKYEVNIDTTNHTMNFTSDAGTSGELPIVIVNKYAFQEVFGIDLDPEYEATKEEQIASAEADREAALNG